VIEKFRKRLENWTLRKVAKPPDTKTPLVFPGFVLSSPKFEKEPSAIRMGFFFFSPKRLVSYRFHVRRQLDGSSHQKDENQNLSRELSV
jgi:hypothetical protein